MTQSTAASPLVRQQLQQHPEVQDVLLVGGHDVIASQLRDCLPPEIRRDLPSSDDPDEFIVWSGDIYGDREGDELPEVPVSRIPVGRSAELVFAALQAKELLRGERPGVRNVARPFSDRVFQGVSGTRPLLVS